MLEDISLMRALPNMYVYTASTDRITKKLIEKISKDNNPTYVRLYRMETYEYYGSLSEKELDKNIEKGMIIKGIKNVDLKKHDVILFTMGDMIDIVYNVQKRLNEEYGINALVIDVIRLKPFNEELVVNILNIVNNAKIVTIEDHSIYGGLRSIISDTITKEENEIINLRKITKIGTTEFGKSGKPLEVLEKFGLGEKTILKKVLKLFK